MCLSPDKHKIQLYDFPYTRKFSLFCSMIGGLAFLSSNAILLVLFSLIPKPHYTFLGNCPPTPPLGQHFALSEK